MSIKRSALRAAKQILKTERDARRIFDLIENPPAPNPQLLAAVDKHRAFSHENHRAAE